MPRASQNGSLGLTSETTPTDGLIIACSYAEPTSTFDEVENWMNGETVTLDVYSQADIPSTVKVIPDSYELAK